MDFEEYKKIIQDMLDKTTNEKFFTKEFYQKLEKQIENKKEFENKIDALAQEYCKALLLNDKMINDSSAQHGYYAILEYCIEHIKNNDKNLTYMFANNKE